MDAIITGESERVGLSVIDNNNVEHLIEMTFSGKIKYHEQDGYTDKSADRTNDENSYVGEARRYAQFYVDQETEYETLPWNLNSEQFVVVKEALDKLSTTEVEQYFGTLLRQSLSHYRDDPTVDTGDVERPFEIPEEIYSHENTILYKQEIYLDEEDEIEAVSGLILDYFVANGVNRTDRYGDAPERDPDACIELTPVPIVALDPLRDYLSYNLRCQIRDCYLGAGIEPPEEYRVLGPGQYRYSHDYHVTDRYPPYHDKHAKIPGYEYEFQPSSPVPLAELDAAMAGGSVGSLYERVRDKLFTRNG